LASPRSTRPKFDTSPTIERVAGDTCTSPRASPRELSSNVQSSNEARSSQAKPSHATPRQAKPSQAKPSQAKPSQAKPSQAKSSRLSPRQPGSARLQSPRPTPQSTGAVNDWSGQYTLERALEVERRYLMQQVASKQSRLEVLRRQRYQAERRAPLPRTPVNGYLDRDRPTVENVPRWRGVPLDPTTPMPIHTMSLYSPRRRHPPNLPALEAQPG